MKHLSIIILIILLVQIVNAESPWKRIWDYEHDRSINHEDIIHSIDCPDSVNCIITQADGSWLETVWSTDAGNSWFAVNDEIRHLGEEYPKPFYVRDGQATENFYYVLYKTGEIKRSDDGGLTFLDTIQLNNKNTPSRIEMFDDTIGIVYQTLEMFYTRDGWDTWDTIPWSLPGTKTAGTVINDYIGTYKGNIDGKSNSYGQFWGTSDKGKTWIKSNLMNMHGTKMFFLTDSIGWIAGGKLTGEASKNYSVIYKTTDKGHTWKEQLRAEDKPWRGLQDISFVDEYCGVACGGSGILYITNDGGETWQRDLVEGNDTLSGETFALTLKVGWAGRTPIIGTGFFGIYKYEGDFFDEHDVIQKLGTVGPECGSKLKQNAAHLELEVGKYENGYEFIISRDEEFIDTSHHKRRFIPHYIVSSLDYSRQYYWKGRGLTVENSPDDVKKTGDWSEVCTFTTPEDPNSSAEELKPKRLVRKREEEGRILFAIEDKKFREHNIQVVDILGRVKINSKLSSTALGNVYEAVSIKQLNTGTYYYNINVEGEHVYSGKFIKN